VEEANRLAEGFPEPQSSFPVPIPIIDSEPDAGDQVTVCFSADWLNVVLGSLTQLTQVTTWDTDDDDTRNLAIARAQRLIAKIYAQGCTVDTSTTTPPYWDESKPEEAGNENPTETGEPWYDEPAYTVLTAFLSTLISPPAAVAFITTVRKLRLFFVYGQHGALTDIFVDGDLVTTVDTYSATESIGVVDVIIP